MQPGGLSYQTGEFTITYISKINLKKLKSYNTWWIQFPLRAEREDIMFYHDIYHFNLLYKFGVRSTVLIFTPHYQFDPFDRIQCRAVRTQWSVKGLKLWLCVETSSCCAFSTAFILGNNLTCYLPSNSLTAQYDANLNTIHILDTWHSATVRLRTNFLLRAM